MTPAPARVRTRFAPSPTGRLHLGNLRIAVFNWLFARHHDGSFILRIEDTDVERNVAGAEDRLMEDLRWLGLEWDEGPDVGGPRGPYRQSRRREIHGAAAERLVASGAAYPCYCTEEELAREAEETPAGTVHRYSGRCRELTPEERRSREARGVPRALRFALPPDLETIDVKDEVRGSISFPSSDFDDFVIVRRDGRATYNFAVVVDDAAMEVTHVLRGAGHLSNTPRQALLFDALEAARPVFCHLPMVLAPGGGKLSKRSGAASLDRLREEGTHPEAVVNYLSLLGWSSPDGREVLSRDELVERIDLARIGAADTTWDPEKLRWMSGQHLQAMPPAELARALAPRVERLVERGRTAEIAGARLRPLAETLRSRLEVLADVEEHAPAFFPPRDDPGLRRAWDEVSGDPGARAVVEAVARDVQELSREDWSADTLGRTVRSTGKRIGARGPDLFHPIRRALTGLTSGPDLGGIMATLGPREVEARLQAVLDRGPNRR